MAYKSIASLTGDSMSNNDWTTQLRATSTDTPRIPVTTRVANIRKADEIRRIDRDAKQEDELDENLDDVAAEGEEDDELEEQDEVETAAETNRS
jgi:hypothetical protein